MRYKSFAYVMLLVSFLITYTMLPDTASAITYNISGTVSLSGFSGSGLAGVTMTLSGDASKTATTGSLGTYSFTGLSNGTYTVTPSKTGYVFDPVSSNVTISGASQNGVNFTAYPTYSISGTVTGDMQEGVLITLSVSGSPQQATTTDVFGSYSFTGLIAGVYTVTPSKTGYTFSPPSMVVYIYNDNKTGINFTSSVATYSISGSVTSSGSGLSGVTMTLSGDASGTATTSLTGSYTFSELLNGTYTITPSKTNYSFDPPSIPVTIADDNQINVNFTAYGTNYSISGQVTGDIKEGVTITLSGDASQTTTTNALGNYTFSGLTNGTYTVTPSKSGYAFDPPSRAVTISGASQTGQDFTATAAGIYSISGTVTLSGSGLSGVTMTLSGTLSRTTSTDSSGNYSFTGLINGTYTVTPSKSGYTFNPPSRTITVADASWTGQDFVASSTAIYSISGKVTGDTPADVTITLSGDASKVTTIDQSGNYSFTELANGDYLVTPTGGYTFCPSSSSVTIRGKNQTDINFTASVAGTYSISGTVTGDVQGDITMNLSGSVTKTTITDSNGFYSFAGLSNGTYTVTPSKPGYAFNPTSRNVSITNSCITGADFAASVLPTYSISGSVSGDVKEGVTMTLSGDASQTTTTNALGSYSFTDLLNGTYTVTPGKSGYTFSPESTSVTIADASVKDKDFISSATCATWGDVIAAYNEYVSGNKTWVDVISTYNQYINQPCP
ncbi:MAG: carboxypeptidase regulatory-like domain-containing protein [Proteobacteria bacterium]|nr:carboxypeptidase regulatory-like domain-containing protein [Pseudomonadota bacterium]